MSMIALGIGNTWAQVTVYKDCSYAGTAVTFTEGNYPLSSIISKGAANDDVSSLKVTAGYQVIFYADDNYSGNTITKTADDDCLVNDGWNDVASSFKVSKITSATWSKASNTIWTPWGESISDPSTVLREYPRPQMVRGDWQSLNGVWDVWEGQDLYSTGGKTGILVPFPIQSALSGVKQNWHYFIYQKNISIPAGWNGKKILLHFEAVDWQSEIFINNQSLGIHKGGYDPFNIDITDKVAAGYTYKLNVKVYDPTDADGHPGPSGKQQDARWNNTDGIWYTPASGIWQSVWMEAVPVTYISDLKIVPNIDNGTLQLTVTTTGASSGYTVEAQAKDGSAIVGSATGSPNTTLSIPIPNQKLWSPSNPFLYNLTVTLKNGGTVVDPIQSYFGMRKISLSKVNGFTRTMLNNQFLFQMGPLDQGYWPDGIYTPPSEDAIIFDLQGIKNLGYNMVRKHVKIEPARWYYNADKIGLLVWQDMPSGSNDTAEKQAQFQMELERMVKTHWNHPSIVMWVPFNEQWGIFNSVSIANFTKGLDPSRLVNENSACCGGTSTAGDMKDEHYYAPPNCPAPDANRALANGEYGGLVLKKDGHLWNPNVTSGSPVLASDAEFTDLFVSYCRLIVNLREIRGLNAAVYTQWTDVEAEINGTYTYDRKVFKGDLNRMKAALQSTYNGAIPINPPAGNVTWESNNMAGYLIRHQGGRARMDYAIDPPEDSYWKMVPGLAGAGVSFQSYNFPNSYLRHQSGEVWLVADDGSQLFKEDATFYQRSGLANGSKVSFESYNFPGRYIRHRQFLLYSETISTDNDKNDATFGTYVKSSGQTIEAENFSSMAGIQTEATADAGGGLNVGWIDTNDWLVYNSINIATTGTYLVEYRVASPNTGGQLSLDYNAGATVLGTVNIPNTGGWQSWTTVSHTVSLNAGNYNFGINAKASGWNFNWWRITSTSGARLAEPEISSVRSAGNIIYPNPVENRLNINSSFHVNSGKFRIINAKGIIVSSGTLKEESIDVSVLASGLYTLIITDAKQVTKTRFIKK